MKKLIGKYLNAWGTLKRTNYVTPLTKKETKIIDNYPTTAQKATTDYYTSVMKSVANDVATVDATRLAAEKAKALVTPTPVKSRVPLISRSERRTITNENKNNQELVARNNRTLEQLRQFGYKGKLDGIIGSGARRAIAEAKRQGYNWDDKSGTYIKSVELNVASLPQFNITSVVNANDFSKAMYDDGISAKHAIGNIATTLIPYAKTLTYNIPRIGKTISTSNANYHSEGTDKQIIAAAYGSGARPTDTDERLRNGETIRYAISKDKNGYLWRHVNGNKDVSEGGLLLNSIESGAHTLGQFMIEESPEGMRIIDNYDFNNRGESGRRVDDGTSNLYDRIRAAAPNKEDNPEYTGQSIDWNISRDAINGYIDAFNNRASVLTASGMTRRRNLGYAI